MLDHIEDTQHLKVFTEALERFEDAFAIYDQNYALLFANSAAYDAMPAYFNALVKGLGIREANRLQVLSFYPDIAEDALEDYTDTMVERFYAGTTYEVNITKNRTIQVRHESLNKHYTLALGIDITEIKSQQTEMETLAEENYRLANTDQLTGLANRRQFIKKLEDEITKCTSTGCTFFVGLIDLNGFKRVNDLYGHGIGDLLLSGIAIRATEFIDETTFLARLGGDEFALITHANESQLDLLAFSAGLCEVLREPMRLSGNDIGVSGSLGWAAFPTDGRTASDLLRKSDYALYKSKHSDSSQAVLFSNYDEKLLRRESEVARQLQTADLEEEFYLEFQPIIDSQTNTIAGLEALVRWDSPVLGLVSPVDFIPLAEKTGVISELTKIILKKALQNAIHWPKPMDLHVNISAVDLGKVHVMSELLNIVKRSAYPTESVIFEVTETAVVDTFENTSEIFELLDENGVRLALDDFGMGFSGLSYLARIPVSCLKIDKYFTAELEPDSDNEKVLKTILYLCENLEINCVIEGIETRSQYEQLMSLGADHMQGFYFSESLKSQDLAAFILNFTQENILRHAPQRLIETTRVA